MFNDAWELLFFLPISIRCEIGYVLNPISPPPRPILHQSIKSALKGSRCVYLHFGQRRLVAVLRTV